jgi:hypothetical protein
MGEKLNTTEDTFVEDDLEARLAAVEAELDRISPDWRDAPGASATV